MRDEAIMAEDLGYAAADRFVGASVRVFLNSGSVLSGNLVERRGKYVVVKHDRGREGVANLDHVASITRF